MTTTIAVDQNLSVRILDKVYQIKCSSDMAQQLQDAAIYLDRRMREIRDTGKIIGLDRIAVITALNIAHEFLNVEQKENKYITVMAERIRDLQRKIEETLTIREQVEL